MDAGPSKKVEIQEEIGDLNPRQVEIQEKIAMDVGLFNAVISGNQNLGKCRSWKRSSNLQPSLLDKTNGKGNTALHIAASLGYLDMTELLITFADKVEKKMELLKMQNLEKNTVLHEAIRNCHYHIVELLIRVDSSLALITNNAGESPLFLAVDRGFHQIALHILEAVPECAVPECYGGRKSMNVLHAAVISRAESGKTALHLAVESGNRGAVEIFLKELAFQDLINEQDEDGNTPLHLAAINGLYPILMTLADDKRVDKWAFNKEGKNIADIIQLDNQFTVSEKEEIMSTWNRHVVLPSSKRVDDSQTTKVQEKREPAEEVKNEEEEVQNEVVVVVKNEEEEFEPKKKRNEEEVVKNLSKNEEEVKNVSEFHLTAITLITTVTFAVSLQVPGGYNSTGKAVLSENNNFKYFLIFDSLAFGTSAGLMLMHLIILMAPSGRFDWVVSYAKRLTIPLIGISVITESQRERERENPKLITPAAKATTGPPPDRTASRVTPAATAAARSRHAPTPAAPALVPPFRFGFRSVID
uniref:PGG domain-containing protein n=1 Tax=Fagus sylvatica TaxID=28930 RepID=A0A2N9EX43_FAGSY